MSYLVLARKYRPQSFDAVIDQDHVTRTLTNAIAANRMAHAILFTGPRGTGKTTVARILAKAMNCTHGPTASPCNDCRSCREITGGKAVDVFEIDGASNNSVDQVRDLRDNVQYMPAHSPYKIYIIDEVHMLSTPAFNALLKTLEEPPDHVMFIFATTEPRKIPVTILSRCQRHDFKRIRLASITDHMRDLCRQEGFDVAGDSLTLIAREAGGSMRDALSLLDQVMACSRGQVAGKDVVDLLGVIDREMIFRLSEALIGGEAQTVLEIVDDIHDRGHDLKRLYADLVEHFRNLMVVKLCRSSDRLIDLPAHELERMRLQVGDLPAAHLNQLFDLLFQQETAVKYSTQPKIALEMACLRLIQAKPALSIENLIDRLEALRKEIGGAPGDPSERTATDCRRPEPIDTTAAKKPHPGKTAGRHKTSATVAPSPAAHTHLVPADIRQTWKKVQAIISANHPALAANLVKCHLKQPAADRLEIEVAGNGFNLAMIQKNRNLEIIRTACRDVIGKDVNVDVRPGADLGNEECFTKSNDNRLKNEALNHPLVTDAIDIFDGKLVDVRILKEEDS